MYSARSLVLHPLHYLYDAILSHFAPRFSHRHRIDRDYRAAIETLEARFCLSATPVAPDFLAVAQDAKTAPARSADYIYNRTGNKQDAGQMTGLGGVALEGGGTDVIPAFQWMINQMGGKGDFLVLRATKDSTYDPYIYKLGGTNSVATLDIPSLAAANNPAVAQIIDKADAIFIAGGAQNDYLNFWKGTPVQTAIAHDVARGVPIGGTSAGTDVIGQFIYSALNNSATSAAALANPFNSDITLDENFVSSPAQLPFLNNTLVDTHFITRDRTGRMTAFLARIDTNGWSPNGQPMGIGINEQTALLIDRNGMANVIGNAKATSPPQVNFFETQGPAQTCQLGQPLTYYPILVDVVLPGGTFNLSNWASSFQITSIISVNSGVLTTTTPSSAVADTNTATDAALLLLMNDTSTTTDKRK